MQFRQCLTFLAIEASEVELGFMDARFSDDKGFNYLQFLAEVSPQEKIENKYRTKITKIMSNKDKVSLFN